MLENVRQVTIRPLIERFIAPGTRVYTDEYDIYRRLPEWGFDHRTVCHSRGEYAHDDDGDGFYEVHQHRRGVLVVVALVVATPSGHFTRKTATPRWASFSLYTTPASGAKVCSDPSWNSW